MRRSGMAWLGESVVVSRVVPSLDIVEGGMRWLCGTAAIWRRGWVTAVGGFDQLGGCGFLPQFGLICGAG